MTVSKCRDKWRAEVFLDGRRVASKSGFVRKRDADDWHDRTKAAMKDQPKVTASTFDELLGHFRSWHLPKVRPGTKRRYEVDLRERIEPAFRHMTLSRITPAMVEQVSSDWQKTLSPKSVNNCLHLLRLLFNKAVKWKLLAESPYGVETLRIAESPYVWWEEEDHIRRFLEAARQSRYYAVYLTALETGLRYGELAGLNVGDVDLATGTVHVHRQWLEREGMLGPPKHGRGRRVDFSPEGDLGRSLLAACGNRDGDQPLFATASGARITKSGVAHKYFKACIRRASVPEISFHGLRHTFASWYMKRHDNVWDLAAILGHSNIKTTMRYAHQSKRARRKPLDLASITHISRTDLGEGYGTNGDHGEKRWRDGRDSNPRAPEKATVA
jgi:integrase